MLCHAYFNAILILNKKKTQWKSKRTTEKNREHLLAELPHEHLIDDIINNMCVWMAGWMFLKFSFSISCLFFCFSLPFVAFLTAFSLMSLVSFGKGSRNYCFFLPLISEAVKQAKYDVILMRNLCKVFPWVVELFSFLFIRHVVFCYFLKLLKYMYVFPDIFDLIDLLISLVVASFCCF